MLNSYLHKYTHSLDEENYQVKLVDDLSYQSNKNYLDGDYWSTEWFFSYWYKLFKAKLKLVGLSVLSDKLVLDCCCGHGYLGEMISKEFGANVIFCDLSQFQLNSLQKRLKEENIEKNLAIVMADMLKMPFAAESFDMVVGNSFLHHLPDIPSALIEFSRILTQEGTLVLMHEPSTCAVFWDSFPLSLIKNTQSTEKEVGFSDLWTFTPKDLSRILKNAGFEDVQVIGTGILSAVLINWFLIIANKLNWRSPNVIYPIYLLRIGLTNFDFHIKGFRKTRISPSLMIIAKKKKISEC